MSTKRKPRLSKSRSAERGSSVGRVRRFRDRKRASGMRLVQMWLPDTRSPEFRAQARHDCQKINASADSHRVVEEMLSVADFSGWT